jgi:hypothetical protein
MSLSKNALVAIKNIGQVKADEWTEMAGGIAQMTVIGGAGGIVMQVLGPVINSTKQSIQNSITGLFSPIINEINEFIGKILGKEGVAEAFSNLAQSLIELFSAAKDLGVIDEFTTKLSIYFNELEMFIWRLDLFFQFLKKLKKVLKALGLWGWIF